MPYTHSPSKIVGRYEFQTYRCKVGWKDRVKTFIYLPACSWNTVQVTDAPVVIVMPL